MRILLVSGSLAPDTCGVGDYTHHLANALARARGDAVAVLTSSRAGIGNVDVPRDYAVLRAVQSWSMAELPALHRALRAWRPDVVHLQYPTQGYNGGWLASLAVPLAALTGATVVRTWHEGFHTRQGLRLALQSLSAGPAVVVRPDFAACVSPPLRPLIRWRPRELILGASAIPQSRLNETALVALRTELLAGARRLFVFFGFLYPAKGVERLLAAADPATDRVIISGEDGVDAAYTAKLRMLVEDERWGGRATMLGRQPDVAIADLLAAADAAVFPFLRGGGVWNSSIHAATMQGTPVIATTAEDTGLSADDLIRYVAASDDAGLRAALNSVPAWRGDRRPAPVDEWERVAAAHRQIYRSTLGGAARNAAA